VSGHARLVNYLGFDEIGQQVVAGMFSPILQLLPHVLVESGHRNDGRVVDHAHVGLNVKDLIDHRPDVLLIRIGDAEQGGNDRRRYDRPELLHVIPGGVVPPLIEEPGAELAHPIFELRNAPRGECLRDETAQAGVIWRIKKIIIPSRLNASDVIISSTVPWAELNTFASRWAASTSTKRLSAQKS
jgi:hypothetical protein